MSQAQLHSLSNRISCLDKGFIELVAHCADDLSVVNAARVSFNSQTTEMSERDEGLIKFLMRERHGTPFEHNFMKFRVKAPIFVFREWHRHRVGHCLPGSSLITTQRNFDSKQRTIEQLWALKHLGIEDNKGRVRILPSCQHPSLRVMNNIGEFSTSEAIDVFQSGMKDVLKIQHEHGSLKCTHGHHIYTLEGWKRADELEVGDRIASVGRVWREEERSIPPSLRRGIGVWTSMQRSNLIKNKDVCYKCDQKFNFKDLELDHIIPVSQNIKLALDINNLAPICVKCHSKKTFFFEQPNRKGTGRLGIIGLRIEKSPVRVSHEMTYDISMSGPDKNFVSDGIVVHNSYNEWSARYSKLAPEFYIPAEGTIVTQTGKPGSYTFEQLNKESAMRYRDWLDDFCNLSYDLYEKSLELGVARQQARAFVPVTMYSEMIWSCNARSLMHFLSLRNHPNAQAEIREYAQAAELIFRELMPVTSTAFIDNDRQAP